MSPIAGLEQTQCNGQKFNFRSEALDTKNTKITRYTVCSFGYRAFHDVMYCVISHASFVPLVTRALILCCQLYTRTKKTFDHPWGYMMSHEKALFTFTISGTSAE